MLEPLKYGENEQVAQGAPTTVLHDNKVTAWINDIQIPKNNKAIYD